MLQAKHILALIESHITHAGFPEKPEGLYAPARYILAAGGKRIRPCLALMSANLFTDDPEPYIPLAMAMEIFHNFTLVHDDIMDNAPVRRGLKTIHEKWNIHTAILSGDAMLIQAYKLLCQTPNTQIQELLNMFNTTALQVCEGQQYDMDFEQRNDVTLSEYIDMISNKTSVLLGCSMYCGALAAGASKQDALNLYKTGLDLGISFQIQDDVLDVYGDESAFGKKPGGDIIQNKKTFLILKTLEKANGDDKDRLQQLFATKHINEQEKINEVMAIFEKYGIRDEALFAQQNYYRSALDALEAVSCEKARKAELENLISDVFSRKH